MVGLDGAIVSTREESCDERGGAVFADRERFVGAGVVCERSVFQVMVSCYALSVLHVRSEQQ